MPHPAPDKVFRAAHRTREMRSKDGRALPPRSARRFSIRAQNLASTVEIAKRSSLAC
jgi:hypothetical protein